MTDMPLNNIVARTFPLRTTIERLLNVVSTLAAPASATDKAAKNELKIAATRRREEARRRVDQLMMR